MQIPDSILLGGITTDITFEQGFYHKHKQLSLGYPDAGQLQIADEAPPALQKEQAFVQIYTNICSIIMGDEQDNPSEIWVTGKQLLAVLRDNPALVDITTSIFDIDSIRYLSKNISIQQRPAVMRNMAVLEFNMLTIDVTENTKLDFQWLALYHEILHLIRCHLAFDLDDEEEEEQIVDGIAFLLVALFSQNDMAWILEDVEEVTPDYHPSSLS